MIKKLLKKFISKKQKTNEFSDWQNASQNKESYQKWSEENQKLQEDMPTLEEVQVQLFLKCIAYKIREELISEGYEFEEQVEEKPVVVNKRKRIKNKKMLFVRLAVSAAAACLLCLSFSSLLIGGSDSDNSDACEATCEVVLESQICR